MLSYQPEKQSQASMNFKASSGHLDLIAPQVYKVSRFVSGAQKQSAFAMLKTSK